MEAPIEPTKDDCCNNGCNPCIFDVYNNQVKLYEKYKSQGDNTYKQADYGISPLALRTFYLIDIVQLSNTQKVLYFQQSNNPRKKVLWKPGDHFLIKYKLDKSSSFTRPYTPVKLKGHSDCLKDYDFLVVVKKYSNGLVSNYLFNLSIGAETLWRGPYGSYNIEPNKFSRIVMIAQGTGVAPFISIIQNILNNEEEMTRIVLYYCCKDILFRDALYEFKSYWNFMYKIFVSIPDEKYFDKKYNEPILFNKFNITELGLSRAPSNDQYLLCGSVQFMEEYQNVLKNEGYMDNVIMF